jgi:hypothetical protein
MFDHNPFQDNLVGIDYCEQIVRETNAGVLELITTDLVDINLGIRVHFFVRERGAGTAVIAGGRAVGASCA